MVAEGALNASQSNQCEQLLLPFTNVAMQCHSVLANAEHIEGQSSATATFTQDMGRPLFYGECRKFWQLCVVDSGGSVECLPSTRFFLVDYGRKMPMVPTNVVIQRYSKKRSLRCPEPF